MTEEEAEEEAETTSSSIPRANWPHPTSEAKYPIAGK